MRKFAIVLSAAILASIALAPAQTKPMEISIAPSQASQLSVCEKLLKDGNADKAFTDIQKNLLNYNSIDLPRALYVEGKAKAAMAEKAAGDAKKKLHAEAALDFMRVVTFFPYAAEAGSSLVETGSALKAMGDNASAAAAWDAAISKYPNSPAQAEAQGLMAKLSPTTAPKE